MQTILNYILNDFKEIEKGIQLFDGTKVYVTIATLIGDNLAIHQCCGLKLSFTSTHPCRYCNSSLEEVRSWTREDVNVLRNSLEYDHQVTLIENAVEPNKLVLSTAFGINERCVLNQLCGFHVTTSTPPDLAHDDLLGHGIVTTKNFLKEICLIRELITLKDLNERIQNFDYGYSEKCSKPSLIKEVHLTDLRHKLKQNSAQMWQLLGMMPVILVDAIPQIEGLRHFKHFIKMLEIINIFFSDEIYVRSLNYLSSCITEYLEDFKSIYKVALTPKQHFLTHRPRLIMEFGPLIQYSSLRPESKHQWFKRYLNVHELSKIYLLH